MGLCACVLCACCIPTYSLYCIRFSYTCCLANICCTYSIHPYIVCKRLRWYPLPEHLPRCPGSNVCLICMCVFISILACPTTQHAHHRAQTGGAAPSLAATRVARYITTATKKVDRAASPISIETFNLPQHMITAKVHALLTHPQPYP